MHCDFQTQSKNVGHTDGETSSKITVHGEVVPTWTCNLKRFSDHRKFSSALVHWIGLQIIARIRSAPH
jgi:hypothetical protein